MSNVYLLIALVEAQDCGGADWRLRISPMFYSPEDFTPKRAVFIDDAQVFMVMSADLDAAGLNFDSYAKYVTTSTVTYPGS